MKILSKTEIELIKSSAIKKYMEDTHGIIQEIYDRGDCEVVFDFYSKEIVPFSIERTDHGKINERTIIGFYKKNNKTETNCSKYWETYCSREQHAILVKQFKDYLKTKSYTTK